MKKSLPQSNALHLTAPPLRGGGNGGGKILRIRAPFCLLRRHFPYQGNHPALPCKLYFVRVGAIHESPAVSAPSQRGLSNAQHLTGGEIFFISLRLLPAAKATSL